MNSLSPLAAAPDFLAVESTDSQSIARTFASQSALNSAIKGVCDILRRSNCAGALQYVPELTWILFLRVFDERETLEAEEAEAVGAAFTPSIASPYRWQDWAAPYSPAEKTSDGQARGWKRHELQEGTFGAFFDFVNRDLLPHLKALRDAPNATPRQKSIAEILSGVERVRVDTEKNFLDVLDKVHAITLDAVDQTHIFTLSQVYEGLLLKMGEKGNDGGQFFTPREVIRVMVRAIAPQVGEAVYDPCGGTCGFLAQSYDFMRAGLGENATGEQIETLKRRTFYGREKENLVYPIGLANLLLHGIDEPHIWHGNTLTQAATYDGLWQNAPDTFEVVLTNPPFGGKEGPEAQTRFAYKTGATQVLFLQHIIDSLKKNGRCAVVVDEGSLFRINEGAFTSTKRKLLDECNLWCILALPSNTFVNAGAGVKTNILFFTKGESTESVWYYDLSDIKVGKKTPLTLDRFDEFFELLPAKADSERSWKRSREELKSLDLKAVNPNRKNDEDTRTVADLLALIEEKGQAVESALAALR